MTSSYVVTGGGRAVGRAVAERAADAASVNGAILPIDGGRSAVGRDPEEA